MVGENRSELASALAEKYQAGASVRSLAEEIGRSYGFVHRVLQEAGVTMRRRGGNTRSRSDTP